jgi:hypothetical protein
MGGRGLRPGATARRDGAWALTGAVMSQLPFGRCVALETSNLFTSFVGGDAAVFGVRVRFFQR